MTPKDVLAAWWAEEAQNIAPTCFKWAETGQIWCEESGILWVGLPRNPDGTGYDNDTTKFDYALKVQGEVRSVSLADPELFSKLSQILKTIEHDHY